MELSTFTWNVIASLVAGLLIAIVGRITLAHINKVAVPLGATIIIATAISLVIFGVHEAVESYKSYSEERYVQEKIDRHLKGHYPEDFEFGWRIEVLNLSPEVNLSLYWPKKVAANPPPHPWEGSLYKYEITKLLKQEGHASEPRWFYTLHPISIDEVQN